MLCVVLPEVVVAGACAAGVLAGLESDPADCAQAHAASAIANPGRTANLKTMRSVALMTSPPTPWCPERTSPASLHPLDVSIRSFGIN